MILIFLLVLLLFWYVVVIFSNIFILLGFKFKYIFVNLIDIFGWCFVVDNLKDVMSKILIKVWLFFM